MVLPNQRTPPPWRAIFIQHLAKTNNISESLQIAGTSLRNYQKALFRNPRFKAAVQRARNKFLDRAEAEAWRRGIEGVEKPVYQMGQKVGALQQYSDTLLIFMLKAYRKKRFREKIHILGASGSNGATPVPEPPKYQIIPSSVASRMSEAKNGNGDGNGNGIHN